MNQTFVKIVREYYDNHHDKHQHKEERAALYAHQLRDIGETYLPIKKVGIPFDSRKILSKWCVEKNLADDEGYLYGDGIDNMRYQDFEQLTEDGFAFKEIICTEPYERTNFYLTEKGIDFFLVMLVL